MIKKLIFLFVLFFNLVLFSQNSFFIDATFTEENIKPYLKYYHDSTNVETIKTIQEKEFSLFGDKIFPGEQEQKFWFQLKIDTSEKVKDGFFFLLNTVSIHKIVVYQNIDFGYKKLYEFKKNGKKNIEIPFKIHTTSSFIFEVSFSKSIYFPIQVENKESLDKLHKSNLVIYGLYYGFVLIVILINMLFYWQTKESFFLYYTLLTFSIALILFELDGLIYFLFGDASWILYIDVVLHTFLLVSLMLFTTKALQLKKNLPNIRWFNVIIISLNTLSFIIYLFTDSFFWYSLGEVFNLIGLLTYWFLSIYFFKKLMFARFMFLGYSIIHITSLFYVLPSEFGMADLGFTPTTFKIGSVIEMLVFLYAISYRHKSLSVAKKNIEQELISHKEQLLVKNKETVIETQQNTESFKNKFKLTTREVEVLNYILKGKGNKEIANNLFLTEATVKYHCSKMYEKTNVKNRSQLTALFNLDRF